MSSFPVTLRLDGRLALVAGGGNVALRKTASLLAAGARVRVVAPQIDGRFDELAQRCELHRRAFEPHDVDGAALAFAATDDDAVNAAVCAAARGAGIWCSNAADPAGGDFTLPATVRLDDVTVAVDTAGASPALAKAIAESLGTHLDPHYGAAAATLRTMREYARAALDPHERAEVLREAAALPPEHLASLNPVDAQHEIDAILERRRGIRVVAATHTVCAATRGSKLALTQTRSIAALLATSGLATTIVTIATTGDRVQDRPLAAIGSQSLFVKELEVALREGRADYAVHSCKDLPSELPAEMTIVAVGAREDARDAFCSERYESFAALPPGARVGTSSMRRRAQLAALRPDLEYTDIRGNVDTRLRKLREGGYDAIVLAMAGLVRLGARAAHTVPFALDELVPAAGQGALAIEMLAGENAHQKTIRDAVNDERAELAVHAERTALAALRGGCQAPVGLHARFDGTTLSICGVVSAPDGSRSVRANLHAGVTTLEQARALGAQLAAQLSASGAGAILAGVQNGGLSGKSIVLPRTQERPSRIAAALRAGGANVTEWRGSEASAPSSGEGPIDMIVFPSSGSVEAARDLLERLRRAGVRPAVAAMGPASAQAAARAGFPPDVTAGEAAVEALVDAVRSYLNEGRP